MTPVLRSWKVPAAVAFVALQVLVPIVTRFADHQPATFGWHMFAGASPYVRFDVLYEDGRAEHLSSASILIRNRNDIDFASLLPPILCRRHGATAVVVRGVESSERVACD